MKGRIAITALTLSAAAFAGILTREGFSPEAYPDPTRGTELPTIGFGSTSGVRMGDTITPVAAINRSLREVTEFEGAIKQCVHVPLYQSEYDAYVKLTHNIGQGLFCRSQITKRLNAQDYRGACQAILLFKYSNGQDCSAPDNRTCRGLWKDRQNLYQQCMSAQQ